MNARIYLGDIVSAARFDENGAAGVAKRRHEGKDVFWRSGSPPVISTSGQSSASTSIRISSRLLRTPS